MGTTRESTTAEVCSLEPRVTIDQVADTINIEISNAQIRHLSGNSFHNLIREILDAYNRAVLI